MLVLALAAEQDVGRLDVAMHQAALVRGVERRGDRGGDALDRVEVEPALVDDLPQVGAGHEAHGEVEHAVDTRRPRWIGTMLGCSSEAASRASLLKRVTASGFWVCSGAMIFSATVRSSSIVGGLVDDPHPAAIERCPRSGSPRTPSQDQASSDARWPHPRCRRIGRDVRHLANLRTTVESIGVMLPRRR